MRIPQKLLFAALPLILLVHLSGCSCGFDCNSDSNGNGSDTASLTLGLSDSIPEDLKQVVIEVDTITFRRSGATPVVVNDFTIGGQLVSTFKIDLLQYRGVNQLEVIRDLQLATGNYTGVDIKILVGSLSYSYVLQDDNTSKQITVNNGILTVPGMQLSSGTQKFVVEFGLAQALQYQSTPENYLLTSTGVRMENVVTGATLSGQVDSALFDTEPACSEKSDPLIGNRVYLYKGFGLSPGNLADVFTSATTDPAPANAIAPFAVASMANNLAGDGEYSFGYIPPGDYTLAFACDTQDDDAVNYDGLSIPLPAAQKYEVSLSEGEKAVCDLTANADC